MSILCNTRQPIWSYGKHILQNNQFNPNLLKLYRVRQEVSGVYQCQGRWGYTDLNYRASSELLVGGNVYIEILFSYYLQKYCLI